jgi:exodeoxyribonuclease VII large subunit
LHARRRERLVALATRLCAGLRANRAAHRVRIARERERVEALIQRARRAMTALIERRAATLARAGQVLAALSYQGVLARGFALVRAPDGRPLNTAAAVSPGLRLDIEFSDGHITAVAEGERDRAPTEVPTKPRVRRGRDDSGQGSLFGA